MKQGGVVQDILWVAGIILVFDVAVEKCPATLLRIQKNDDKISPDRKGESSCIITFSLIWTVR